MKVKIKKLNENAVIPAYATDGSAGMDLTASRIEFDDYGNLVAHTDLAFEIPKGYVGLIFPRSSISKQDISLTNCVGVIDSDYRGEVTFKFKSYFRLLNPIKVWFGSIFNIDFDFRPLDIFGNCYDVGDRVGQIIIMKYPTIEFVESEELTDTERGDGGYGSTGR